MIFPLEGEMSPKATEGVAARRAPTPGVTKEDVGSLRETTPSGLPAISPTRGEISQSSGSTRHPQNPLQTPA
ncbi:MAG: hypothetical protein EOQ52_23870 [Mesorhizobium sp.]|nr:MAG: hypothetical protein EOQ49_23380 [Mesorhizobium sp.]RWB84620.1 MAG: hypothetical protein EOQ52_23870 [Mesorhizobium sp.]TGS72076.1 hypothetical protein EN844_03725 [Mesorhizobium sp. M3A.F.Ca.ET.201.01.1.1]TGT61142.1 hypothetical protein EN813_019540 [Mesorhizobium sp. M00.F.Ca.ET.170.01.1.1]